MRTKPTCWIFLLAFVVGLFAPLQAQVTVNEDGSLRICYSGDAKRVSVLSDFHYTDEDSSRYTDRTRSFRLRRDSDGCFRTTTRPVHPEMYTYCFRVDGKRLPDPLCSDTAWQMMHRWNIVAIGGTEQADLYQQPAQQGTFIRTSWYSSAEGINRRVNIYLPAGYQPGQTCVSYQPSVFPVLYLIHGINGYEGSWGERGRAIQILENMIASGKCQPMILVMPDVNYGVHEDRPSHHTLWNNVINYPRLCHNHDIEHSLAELIAMIDSTYRVSSERYIVGFSDGARMAANLANMRPSYFRAVGLFSPVVHRDQMPQDSTAYAIYVGRSDMFYRNAKRFHRRMEKAGIPHRYIETIGGHTWRNWRIYLSDFLNNFTK